MFRLYGFPESGNSYKVALMLALCDLPWQPVFVDYFNGETRSAPYRSAVNAMGEAPVLDIDGERLTQSGVILHRLARMTGRFAPEGDAGREVVWRWILFDNHKFTSYLATYRFLRTFAKDADPAVVAFFKARVDGALAIAELRLADHPFIAGDAPTIADVSMAGYVFYPATEIGYDFSVTHPAIAAWRARIAALPGWRAPYDLIPGAPLRR